MADWSWFWEEVGQTAGLTDYAVTMKRSLWRDLDTLTPHLQGHLGGRGVEAGIHYSVDAKEDPTETYAAVAVSGLPPGLIVGPFRNKRPLHLLGSRALWIECGPGRGRELRAAHPKPVRVEMEGLILEQDEHVFDIDAYVNPARRQLLCTLGSQLEWTESGHRVVNRFDDDPYPRRRDVKRSARGDSEATQQIWAYRDRLVDLLRTTVSEADLVISGLSIDADNPHPEPRT
jgi:hypothetical protein